MNFNYHWESSPEKIFREDFHKWCLKLFTIFERLDKATFKTIFARNTVGMMVSFLGLLHPPVALCKECDWLNKNTTKLKMCGSCSQRLGSLG